MARAVAFEAVGLCLGVGGLVWIRLGAGGGVSGVSLAVVLLLESAIGARVGFWKALLARGLWASEAFEVLRA